MSSNPVIENKTPADSVTKIGYGIYILYLIGVILPILPIIGVVLAYVFRVDAVGVLTSHYQYMIRTFWIGMLYFLISALTVFIVIGFLLSFITLIWWIIRVIIGLRALSRNEPIVNPQTWGL